MIEHPYYKMNTFQCQFFFLLLYQRLTMFFNIRGVQFSIKIEETGFKKRGILPLFLFEYFRSYGIDFFYYFTWFSSVISLENFFDCFM
jgi:hypothetical protein